MRVAIQEIQHHLVESVGRDEVRGMRNGCVTDCDLRSAAARSADGGLAPDHLSKHLPALTVEA